MTFALKACLISAAFAASTLSVMPAHANDPAIDPASDMYKEPLCGARRNINRSLLTIAGQEPTGIKASNDKWDMEIYQNKARGDWTLVGQSKDPEVPAFMGCMLSKGLSNNPYTSQKWYAENFAKNKPQVAEQQALPKPAVN